jgi:hypothetical protein
LEKGITSVAGSFFDYGMRPEWYAVGFELCDVPSEHIRGILKPDAEPVGLQKQRQIVVRDCFFLLTIVPWVAGTVVIMGTGRKEPGPFDA